VTYQKAGLICLNQGLIDYAKEFIIKGNINPRLLCYLHVELRDCIELTPYELEFLTEYLGTTELNLLSMMFSWNDIDLNIFISFLFLILVDTYIYDKEDGSLPQKQDFIDTFRLKIDHFLLDYLSIAKENSKWSFMIEVNGGNLLSSGSIDLLSFRN
jgi:hypothetical protein